MTVALLVLTCQAAVLLKMKQLLLQLLMVYGNVEENHQKSRELAKLDFVLLAYCSAALHALPVCKDSSDN